MRAAHQATSIVIAAALTLSLAACADDTHPGATKPTAVVSATPGARLTPSPTRNPVTPAADNPLGIDWSKQAPFTGAAADKFGAANVMAAYRLAVTFSLQEGYSNLMTKGYDARPVEFSFVKPFLTNSLQELWDKDVKGALARDAVAARHVSLLTSWNTEGGQDLYRFRKGEKLLTLGRSFSAARTSLETGDAQEYLVIDFTVSRNIRLVKGGKPVLLPLAKAITYRMIPNGLKDIPWLIDSWTIAPKAGKPTPDPLGAAP